MAKAAARSAYYAAFQAAEALILERTGKIAKTHSGVRSEFARLAKDELSLDRTYSAFLAEAYKYKEIGDYGVGLEAAVEMGAAMGVIQGAQRFLDMVSAILEPGEPKSPQPRAP